MSTCTPTARWQKRMRGESNANEDILDRVLVGDRAAGPSGFIARHVFLTLAVCCGDIVLIPSAWSVGSTFVVEKYLPISVWAPVRCSTYYCRLCLPAWRRRFPRASTAPPWRRRRASRSRRFYWPGTRPPLRCSSGHSTNSPGMTRRGGGASLTLAFKAHHTPVESTTPRLKAPHPRLFFFKL